ncbi:MAG: recombination mediator RecR [Lactobacillaceae bacterium]|nr:recombination mediator RecR [Lactobacillaceae bacterium]
MIGKDIEKLIKIISKLPSLGPRSSRRIVLHLLKKKDSSMQPLIEALSSISQNIKTCEICGNYDTASPCSICSSDKKLSDILCVVQDVSDLWAMEKVSSFNGRYHVLGGVLSALDGVAPEDLNIENLLYRIKKEGINEVILALPATVDGQITAHYLLSKLKEVNVNVTTLAQGIPMGAELDYMDEGTLQLAFSSRKAL